MSWELIKIRGARVNNLKNIDLDIPKNKLVVITGLSGSGKSSLAFDTIYAEGQRRYIESLSAYARQFLGVMDKPDVDKIDGLSPAIAIDQRSVAKNPRSTVGTITEIYDYLRLLFSRVGKPYCPQCGQMISKQSPSLIVEQILGMRKAGMQMAKIHANSAHANANSAHANKSEVLEVLILAPLVRGRKGEHRGVFEQAQQAGFVRVRVDGVIYRLEEAVELELDKQKKHNIEVVVDKIKILKEVSKDERARIADSVEIALKVGNGTMMVSVVNVVASSAQAERNNPEDSSQNNGVACPPVPDDGRRAASSRKAGTPRNDKYIDKIFSELFACQKCGISLPEIEPRLFSFNSPFGACLVCQGLGTKMEIDPKMIIPNPRLTLAEGAIRPWATASHRARLLTPEPARHARQQAVADGRSDGGQVGPLRLVKGEASRQSWYYWKLSELAAAADFSMNKPAGELPKKIVDKILYGSLKDSFEGVIPNLERRWKETDSDFARAEIEKYMIIKKCPACQGKRLRDEALAIKIQGKPHLVSTAIAGQASAGQALEKEREKIKNGTDISQISAMSIGAAKDFFQRIKLGVADEQIARSIIKEILRRLQFLIDVGLDYLTIERESTTLSGGESQRIRLVTQIGSGLSGVIYILDEPSVGLHQRDLSRLIITLKQLRDLGNSVVVVEHDAQTILAADWVVDVGPGAGAHGGKIIFAGTPKKLLKSDTLTGQYLSGKLRIIQDCHPDPAVAGEGSKKDSSASGLRMTKNINGANKYLEILGATEHNLKNIDVKIPLQKFVAVTGVSGSGKSTLVNDILGTALARDFYGAHQEPGAHKEIKGTENLDKVIIVDQSPIGRTPRSNPATYTGAFTIIRDLFTQTQEAKVRGYGPGRFSFNVKGGRCENCEGDGVKKIEMYFLPDVYVECEVCHGQRYNKETLEVEYKGKNIAQILAMAVEEAYKFFKNIPTLEQKLRTLKEVGLGYMKVGQSATTLSGGEAQRIKLATELARRDTGRTLYILDEPTTGLHFDDIKKLLNVLHQLVARGNTILIIEHNPDVIKNSDWIIDLGPEGGDKGGYLLTEGTVNDIKKNKRSYTAKYL